MAKANQYADNSGDVKQFTAPQAPAPVPGTAPVIVDDQQGWDESVPGAKQDILILIPEC